MKVRLGQLWKVPVYCVAAGCIGFYLLVYALSSFAVVTLPDGSYTINNTLSSIFSILLFLLSLLIGYFLFRNMTKTEIFWSASIIVVPLLVIQLLQLFTEGSSLSVQIGLYLTYVTEWSRIISQICYAITHNAWIGAILVCLAPYLFVPFGSRPAPAH